MVSEVAWHFVAASLPLGHFQANTWMASFGFCGCHLDSFDSCYSR